MTETRLRFLIWMEISSVTVVVAPATEIFPTLRAGNETAAVGLIQMFRQRYFRGGEEPALSAYISHV